MKVIKQTTSLSPLTLKPIPATIVEENDMVYMIKQDENGMEYKALVENDLDLYKELTSITKTGPGEPQAIHVNASSACNLDCNLCYATYFKKDSFLQKDELEKIIAPFKGKSIILSGKEPTMNPNLHELIPAVNKNNKTLILTNGIKFADFDYLKKLYDAGEFFVTFSLNGITDNTLNQINAAPLRDQKLKALENLKKLKIPTVISTTVSRDINEEELGPIYKYCLDNYSWIVSMRIRSAISTGKHLNVEQYTLSDLLNLYSKISGHNLESIHNSARFIGHIVKNSSYFMKKSCAYQFLVNKKNPKRLVGGDIDLKSLGTEGKSSFFEKLKPKESNGANRFNTDYFQMDFRSWPNIFNIDLQEMNKCHSYCHYDLNSPENGVPFCINNAICSQDNS